MSNLEQEIAEQVLNEKWSNHPEDITSKMLINTTKQVITEGKNIDIKKGDYSIAECCKEANLLTGTNGNINISEEIEKETEVGKDWLRAAYNAGLKTMIKDYAGD